MSDVSFQPTPPEYSVKVDLFSRLMAQALEIAQHRRGIGARELSGVFGTGDLDTVVIEARQSGLIRVNILDPPDRLHLEETVFLWDEAMLAPKMSSIPS